MTASDHSYETSGDRASLAREAGVGKLSFISVLAGTLVAYGAFAVLAALLGAATSGPAISEEEHEVVLREEEPVVEKRAVPKERVRLDKDTVTDERQVSEEVRKEQIEVQGDQDRLNR